MARNETFIDRPPDDVFAVLADPRSYGEWVVGSQAILDADERWPAPGTRFRHRSGIGPLAVSDETVVEAVDPPRHLRLRAHAGPLGSVRIDFELRGERGGTRVTLVEDPAERRTALAFTPLTHLLVRARNAETLRRLGALARRR